MASKRILDIDFDIPMERFFEDCKKETDDNGCFVSLVTIPYELRVRIYDGIPKMFIANQHTWTFANMKKDLNTITSFLNIKPDEPTRPSEILLFKLVYIFYNLDMIVENGRFARGNVQALDDELKSDPLCARIPVSCGIKPILDYFVMRFLVKAVKNADKPPIHILRELKHLDNCFKVLYDGSTVVTMMIWSEYKYEAPRICQYNRIYEILRNRVDDEISEMSRLCRNVPSTLDDFSNLMEILREIQQKMNKVLDEQDVKKALFL